ncbi:MAG: hypothetical protein EBS01_12315, partial [Verrucomicrobia bacterium]|nr:hypothetical protein [Verrucomicrobiota bacterium]
AEPVKRRPASKETAAKDKPAPSSPEKDKSLSEDEKFNAVRKEASEDPKVSDLRAKADAAKTDDAANKAMRLYLHALYEKMRELAPNLEERINLTESAANKALAPQK